MTEYISKVLAVSLVGHKYLYAKTRLGFKPQANSESPLQWTGKQFQSTEVDFSYDGGT
ncbi:hypothetical protein [Aerosakkonema funiforme]|uniref:hypothetical protein n=1 Tax=Aerosakkonema funiforme TaxID=1246630 RepID=UPI0035BBE8B4